MPLSAVLAMGGLIIGLIVLSGIGLIVLTVVALFKMRKDEFWDEQQ